MLHRKFRNHRSVLRTDGIIFHLPRESMLGFTYTAFLTDPESTSPPQADNRMKIIAMMKFRCFIFALFECCYKSSMAFAFMISPLILSV